MKNQPLPRTSERVRGASLRSLALSFGFALGAWLVTPALAVDVELFGVHKGQAFVQTNNAAPVAAGSSNYFFTAFARAKAFNSMRDARVRAQGDVDRRLPLGHDFAFYNFWAQTDFYASQAALDAAHPDTNYVLTLGTVNDGQISVTFNLTGAAYPNAPQIANFSAAQTVRAETDFTLSWNAFAGGTTNDHIRVEIEDVLTANNTPDVSGPLGQRIFRTGDPRDVLALDGTATSVVIPARTLRVGHVYRARITFVKVTSLDTNSYPQVIGVAGYVAKTEFPLHTVDAALVGVVKGERFMQTDANAASPGGPGFLIMSFIDGRGTQSIASATLQLPNGGALLTLDATNEFGFKDANATSAGLDAAYPDGVYQMTLTGVHDHSKVFNIALTNVLSAMATPHISNWPAAQQINSGRDFTLTWDALAGATAGDYVQIQISDPNAMNNDDGRVFETAAPLTPRALNGTNTSVTIPAFTLKPGVVYQGTFTYARLLAPADTTAFPGAVGIGACMKRVDFSIRTPDVRAYSLVKRQEFLQSNNLAPVAASASNFLALAHLQTPGTNNVTAATLTVPGGGPVPFPTNNFTLLSAFTSQAALDANFPAGAYQINLTGVQDGAVSLTLNIPATTFPNAPQVAGYDLLQNVNPHRAVPIVWNNFSGGTANDFIRFEIFDPERLNKDGAFQTVFSTPQLGESTALTGTNSGVLVPADTLQPGKNYQAMLVFAKVCTLDTTSYPGVIGSTRMVSATAFNLHTRGTHPSAPIIGGIIRSNAQTFLQFLGETNRPHRIEFATDLKLRNWTGFATNTAFDGNNTIMDGGNNGNVRYYRIVPLFP